MPFGCDRDVRAISRWSHRSHSAALPVLHAACCVMEPQSGHKKGRTLHRRGLHVFSQQQPMIALLREAWCM